jgi:BTB And C-terminal Kelch
LSPSNACSLLEQCLGFDETAPADICASYIGVHAATVLSSESFNRASVAVIRRIAALETLSVGEIDFFEACVAWARARGGDDAEQLRKHMSPVLDLIRFPTMSPEDFARRVVPLNILSDSEACNVYKYLTCPEKSPKRFITVKRKKPASSESTTKRDSTTETTPGKSNVYPDIGSMMLSGESPSAPDILPSYSQYELPPKYEA